MFGKGFTNSEQNVLGFHLRIPVSKFSNKLVYLSSEGIRSHITGQKYFELLEPLFFSISNFLFHRSYMYFFACIYIDRS